MTDMDSTRDQDAMTKNSSRSAASISPRSPQAFGGHRITRALNLGLPTQDNQQLPPSTDARGDGGAVEEDRQDRRVRQDQDLSIFGFSFRKKKSGNGSKTPAAPFKRIPSSSSVLATCVPSASDIMTTDTAKPQGTLTPASVAPSLRQAMAGMPENTAAAMDEDTNTAIKEQAPATIPDQSVHVDLYDQRMADGIQITHGADVAVAVATAPVAEPAKPSTFEPRQQLIWRGSWIAPSLIVLQESNLSKAKKRSSSSLSLSRKQIDLQLRGSSMARDALAQAGLQPLVQELKGMAMALSNYEETVGNQPIKECSAPITAPDQPLVADGFMEMHIIAKIQLLTFPSYLLDIHHRHGAYEVFVSSNSTETLSYFQEVFGQSPPVEAQVSEMTMSNALLASTGLLVRAVGKPKTSSMGRSVSFVDKTSAFTDSAATSQKFIIQDSQMFLVYAVLSDTGKDHPPGAAESEDETSSDVDQPENGYTISMYAYPLVDHAQFSAEALFNQPVMERLEAEYIEHQRRRRERRCKEEDHQQLTQQEPEDSAPSSLRLNDPELDFIMSGAESADLSHMPPVMMDITEDESQWEETLLLEALERSRIWKPYNVISSQPNPAAPTTAAAAPSTANGPGQLSRHTALDSLSSAGAGKRVLSRAQTMAVMGSQSMKGSSSGLPGGSVAALQHSTMSTSTLARHKSLDSHNHPRRKGVSSDGLSHDGSTSSSSSSNTSSGRRMRESGTSGRDKATEALRMRLLGPGSIRKSSDQGRLSLPPASSSFPLFDNIKEPSSPSKRRQSTGTRRKTTTPTMRSTMRSTMNDLAEMMLNHYEDDDAEEGVGGGDTVFQGRLPRSILTSPSARSSIRRRVTMGGNESVGTGLMSVSRRKSNPPTKLTSTPLARSKSSSNLDDNPFWTPSAVVAPTFTSSSSSASSSKTSLNVVAAQDWLNRASAGDEDDVDDEEDQANYSMVTTGAATSPVRSLFVYGSKGKEKADDRQENEPMIVDSNITTATTKTTAPAAERQPSKPKTKSAREQNEQTIQSLVETTLNKHNVREDQEDYEQCVAMLVQNSKFSMRRDIDTRLYQLHEVEQIMDRAAALL